MTHNVETIPIFPPLLNVLEQAESHGAFALRTEDAAECFAMGLSPMEGIRHSVAHSIEAYAVSIDNDIVALWGYSARSRMSGVGYPWLLTTPHVEEHKMFFARTSRIVCGYLLSLFPRLEVYVDARYLRAQIWLKWLGFAEHSPVLQIKQGNFVFMSLDRKTWES